MINSNRLISELRLLQRKAAEIDPPSGTLIERASPGLRGPAFFPEGLGLTETRLRQDGPIEYIVVGHNFGSVAYRREIDLVSREDDKATWRNLDALLIKAHVSPDLFFRTNWFVGLLPGKEQTGKFLRGGHEGYEAACRNLLLDQIRLIRPKALFFLGCEVPGRAYTIAPSLTPWKGAERWIDVDQSDIGHLPRMVSITGTDVSVSVAALLHTSFGSANEGRRMQKMKIKMSQAEIVRHCIANGLTQ